MATFTGCTATGNRLGGFYTNNPHSEFVDCAASDNGGPGFVDDSKPQPPKAAKPSRGKRFGRFLTQVSINALGGAIGGSIAG